MSGILRINKPMDLVDPDTNLKVREITEGSILKSGELICSQREYLKSLDEKVKMDMPSIKLFPVTSEAITKVLNLREIRFLLGPAVKYLCYDDSALRYNGKLNGKPLDAKLIAEYEHMNLSTVRCTISSLKKKQIIGYISTGGDDNYSLVKRGNIENKLLVVNPYIFMKGSCSCRKVLSVFSESIWKAIYEGKINAEDLENIQEEELFNNKTEEN